MGMSGMPLFYSNLLKLLPEISRALFGEEGYQIQNVSLSFWVAFAAFGIGKLGQNSKNE